jgi:type I restriction enzyme S subunit
VGIPHGDWASTTLDQVAVQVRRAVSPNDAQGLPYVGLEHIDSGDPHLNRSGLPAEVRSAKSAFKAGDVLYGKLRPYLDKAVLAESPGICSTDIIVLRCLEHIIPDYLVALLHSQPFVQHAVRHVNGVNHPRTSWSALSRYRVLLPPLPEQRAIARALKAVQAARDARRRELELERERKAALMEHLFTKGTRGEPTKMTEIGEMPESWEVVELGALCGSGGWVQTGPFGSQLHASDYRDTGIPVVNHTHLRENDVDESQLPRISPDRAHQLKRYSLDEGDILISRRGDFGRYSLVSGHRAGWLGGTGCLIVRIRSVSVSNGFVALYIGTRAAQDYLMRQSVGTTMPNLNIRILRALKVPLPSVEEQMDVVQALELALMASVALRREIALLDELFKALLQELMTGRLSAVGLIEGGTAEPNGGE